MKKNMGTVDRVARFLIALTIVALFLLNVIPVGTLALVLLLLAGIFLLTGLIGVCPLYLPFGIRTCEKRHAGQ